LETKIQELVEEQVEVDRQENDGMGIRSFGRADRKGQIERLMQKADRTAGISLNRPVHALNLSVKIADFRLLREEKEEIA